MQQVATIPCFFDHEGGDHLKNNWNEKARVPKWVMVSSYRVSSDELRRRGLVR